MIVKSRKSIVVIIVGLLVLIALTSASLLPDIHRYPVKFSVKHHARAYLEKTFDLAGSREFNERPVNWIKTAVNLVTAFPFNGAYPVELEELRIDIKFKHWQKLIHDRDLALEKTVLREPHTVPAKIRFRGQVLKSELRLKGDLGEHWLFPIRWSFRIEIKNGSSIKGFTRFSLQRPAARQFPFDQLYHYWHQSIGGLAPDFDFVRVVVNGDYWGIMLMEEHVSKAMLELNGDKEAPLFKLTSEDEWYHYNVNKDLENKPKVFYGRAQPKLYGVGKYRDDDRMLRLYSYAISQIRKLNRGGIKPRDIIDVDAAARSFILAAIWGNRHTLTVHNSRYYLNPYTLMVHPINTDQGPYKRNPQDPLAVLPLSGIYGGAVASDSFENTFMRVFADLEATLPNLDDRYRELCANFPLDCPAYDPEFIRTNMRWITDVAKPAWFAEARRRRAEPPPVRPVELSIPGPSSQDDPGDDRTVEYPEHIVAEHYDDGNLRIYNLLTRPVKVTAIRLVCTRKTKSTCRDRSLLDEEFDLKASVTKNHLYFDTLQTPLRDLGSGHRIEIDTERNGQSITQTVSYTLRTDLENPLLLNREFLSDNSTPNWLTLDGEIASVAPGTWIVEKPVILPVGKTLHVPAGTTLRFSEDAYLIVRGALIAEGRKQAPIEFVALRKKWKGLYVLKAMDRSSLSYVRIRDTDNLIDGVLQLTGGMTFYQSDVNISHTVFDGSMADDALNIVRSNFNITDTVFRDSLSDAFDSDFSDGVIEDTAFLEAGGDGVDLSGSKLDARDLRFVGIKDKAISVGETSFLTARSITVMGSGSAIVSKDGSRSIVDGLTVTASRGYAAMTYVKKSVYGAALLEIVNSNLRRQDVINQDGNTLRLEGQDIAPQYLDVGALYATEQMRK